MAQEYFERDQETGEFRGLVAAEPEQVSDLFQTARIINKLRDSDPRYTAIPHTTIQIMPRFGGPSPRREVILLVSGVGEVDSLDYFDGSLERLQEKKKELKGRHDIPTVAPEMIETAVGNKVKQAFGLPLF